MCCVGVPGRLTRNDYARAALSARALADQPADGIDRCPPSRGLAPYRADMPHRRRLGEGQDDHAASVAIGALGRELGQESDAGAGCDHLPQRLEAGGAEILALARPDAAADLQRLIPEAMTLLEKEQRLTLQIGNLDALTPGERVALRQRHRKWLGEELAGLESLQVHRQRQNAKVELAAFDF